MWFSSDSYASSAVQYTTSNKQVKYHVPYTQNKRKATPKVSGNRLSLSGIPRTARKAVRTILSRSLLLLLIVACACVGRLATQQDIKKRLPAAQYGSYEIVWEEEWVIIFESETYAASASTVWEEEFEWYSACYSQSYASTPKYSGGSSVYLSDLPSTVSEYDIYARFDSGVSSVYWEESSSSWCVEFESEEYASGAYESLQQDSSFDQYVDDVEGELWADEEFEAFEEEYEDEEEAEEELEFDEEFEADEEADEEDFEDWAEDELAEEDEEAAEEEEEEEADEFEEIDDAYAHARYSLSLSLSLSLLVT